MKVKHLFLLVSFFIIPFINYSQQWHQYSDSIIANVNKRNYDKAAQFIVIADSEIGQSKIVKDTMYADYLYSKGVFNYFKFQNSLEFFIEALAIWKVSKKVNYFKVMKNHYFMGKNYINEEKYELSIASFKKCYEINKKYKLKANANFNEAVYLLAALYHDKRNFDKVEKYASEFIEYNNETAISQFNFKYTRAFEFKKDLIGQEKVLLEYLALYNEKKINDPNLLFKIYFELFFFHSKNNNVLETIKFGEKAFEIQQKENLTDNGELKVIFSSLISKYGEKGDNINRDKYQKLQYSYFSEDEKEDYYSELERLIKAEDFETFKVKFYEYEEILKSQGNYDDLFSVYALSLTLFEQNILFKKDEVEEQIEIIKKNNSALSDENKLYFDILLAEFFVMTNNYSEALKICNKNLNIKDINIKLMFYRFKTICENTLANADAKKTAYKTLDIANSIYGDDAPQLLPYLALILDVDVTGVDKNTTKIATKALQILYTNKLEQTDVASGIWLSLGTTAFNKKNLKDATIYLENCLRILESTKVISNPICYYSGLLQLASVKMLEKDFDSSLEYSNKVKVYLEENPNMIQIASANYYYQLGDFFFYQDQFESAKSNYEKSFSIYGEAIPNSRKINYILCDYFINNDVKKAILSLERYQEENDGIAIASKIIYLLKYNSGDLIASRNLLVSQLKTLISDNDQYFHLLSDYEKEILYKGFSDQFEFLNSYLLSNDSTFLKDYIALRFYSKSLLFSNSFKIDELDDKNKELYSELKSNTVLINRSNESKVANLQGTEDLKSRNREIEKFLSAKNSSLSVPTLKELTFKLKVNEAYVEIIRINKQSRSATKKGIDIVNQFTDSIYYGAIVIKKNAAPKFVVIDDTNLMEIKYFPDFQSHIQGKNKLVNDVVSYHLLFEKIDAELSNIDNIYLVTDGVYNSINVESIYNPNKQKYILDYLKVELISNVRTVTNVQKERNVTANLRATLLGNPDFDIASNSNTVNNSILERNVDMELLSELKSKQKISYLPGTEKEIQSINGILKESNWTIDLYSKENASEDNLKKIESPDILHIATHGFFNNNESAGKKQTSITSLINANSRDNSYLKSGLFLSGAQNSLNNEYIDGSNNGVLFAEEAKSLNLKNTELVVLSACETGLGENLVGEGVIGLQRAFMIAGAKSVIMSLWKVNDFSSQKLMTLFYTKWIKNKMTKKDAFNAAKVEMKKLYPQPYYWAGFVLLE
jgi:CHAT domain-containing protein